ncbi:hypothetical protein C6P45_000835 [Maudiozyma exigua]|uniref:Uncharacterized protein n=1 Tax=Maudiozyma exigua TaxID=34358 RepID=A0A9P7B889_MAUEX|nr:hypothetical protein C6P45_000835 [Kazachstania exigua]
MHSRNGKHLDVISNDSEGCLSNENTKTPNLSDYQIHTDTEETSSDDNFNNNVDSSSISRASSLFRGRSKGSHISNNDSDSEKPHRSFSELLSSIFHKNKTRNSNPVSSSFATTETHRENFLNDEYQDDENYASNLDNLLYQDIEKSPSSQISFNMNSSHDADQMDKDTPLTPNTNDNKVTSQFNNGVRVTNSDSYYSNKLTNTYSKFYNFYESLDIGTLSQENNTDIDSLMRHIKIIWDNKQNKINSLQEVNLSLEQKVDVLQRKNSNIQSQLEEKNQSHNNLADKYKKCTAIFYKLVETCNNEIDSDQEENYHSKTKNNQDFNKLIEIVQNAPN